MDDRYVVCLHCGKSYKYETIEQRDQVRDMMLIHEVECFQNPLVKKIKQLERRFPMIDGPDIDWVTAEYIYKMYLCLHGNSQSLERFAERGGYYWGEIAPIVHAYMKKKALEGK